MRNKHFFILCAVLVAASVIAGCADDEEQSANANLSTVMLSHGTLDKVFAPGDIACTASVPNTFTETTLTGIAEDAKASVSEPVTLRNLVVGEPQIATVSVTAQNGTVKTCVIYVDRKLAGTDATLKGITLSRGALNPVFATGTADYTASVAYSVSTVTVTGTTTDPYAHVSEPVTLSGLVPGAAQTATFTVTAENGTTVKTYTVAVTRVLPATNAGLAGITLSSGTLKPAFAAGTASYTVLVPATVSSLTVTGIRADTNATVTPPVTLTGLVAGVPQTATITVTAEDGTTARTYTVRATRAGNNADLTTLTLSAGTLIPAFSAATTAYKVHVVNSVASLTATGTAVDASATVSGQSGQSVALAEGANTISVTVASSDGTTDKTYTITVNRNGTTPSGYSSHVSCNMVGVPTGCFQRDENPANTTTVSTAFRIGETEITREQWVAIMGAGNDPSNTGYSSGTSDPVQNVSWYQCIAFCNKMSLIDGLEPVYRVTGVDFTNLAYASIPDQTGWAPAWDNATVNMAASGYRLPTEMEWQWAAMGATDARTLPWSGYTGGTQSAGDCAWYANNSVKSHPAGSLTANALGIKDMSGNVAEYCQDWWNDWPGGALDAGTLGIQGSSAWRINRGGSFFSTAAQLAVADRGDKYGPMYAYANIGLRVVRR